MDAMVCLGQGDSCVLTTDNISIVDSSLDTDPTLLGHMTDPLDNSPICAQVCVCKSAEVKLSVKLSLGSRIDPFFFPDGEQVSVDSTRTSIRRLHVGPPISDGRGESFVILQHSGTCEHTHTQIRCCSDFQTLLGSIFVWHKFVQL